MSTYNPDTYRKWYAANRDHKCAYCNAYYAEHRDKFAEQHAVYYSEKGPEIRAQQNARNAALRVYKRKTSDENHSFFYTDFT